jgi:hypothetical protein
MKSLLLIGSMLLMAAPSTSQKNQEDLGLPKLHKIQKISLSPSYSCRSVEDFQKGYVNTALFLTDRIRSFNSPVLFFDGACKSADTFAVATGGDDVSAIADYGDIPLANMAPFDLFGHRRPDSPVALFTERANVKLGHSYGVLINKRHVRGFFFFRVMAHIPNEKVELEYVVMDYQEIETKAESRGFDWSTRGYYFDDK